MKGEAAAFSVRAQRCQSHYFSTTPRISFWKLYLFLMRLWWDGVKFFSVSCKQWRQSQFIFGDL